MLETTRAPSPAPSGGGRLSVGCHVPVTLSLPRWQLGFAGQPASGQAGRGGGTLHTLSSQQPRPPDL